MKSVKVIFLGDTQVGKTALALRATLHTFEENTVTTIGADHLQLTVESNGAQVWFTIWDTAGQEAYRGLVSMYFRSAQCAILVFDLTNRESFDSVDRWIADLRNSAPDCEVALVGNKVDREGDRQVQFQEGLAKAESLKCSFYSETSAATGQGVSDIFERFVTSPAIQRRLLAAKPTAAEAQQQTKDEPVKIDKPRKRSKVKRSC
jgi:small GTP-binding protein